MRRSASSYGEDLQADPAAGRLERMSELAVGSCRVVASLDERDELSAHKLLCLGVLPGVTLTLEAKGPALVFRIGHARFAIDRSLGERVLLQAP